MKQHSLVPNLRAGAADSRQKLLFADAYGRRPYDENALRPAQTSVLRLARALAETFDVTVAQRGLTELRHDGWVTHCGLETVPPASFDIIVALRSPLLLREVGEANPGARMLLWTPDYPERGWTDVPSNWWREAQVQLVCSSESVRRVAKQTLQGLDSDAFDRCSVVIRDPILEEWVPDRTPRDPGRLLCLTAPDEGLDEALRLFSYCRGPIPELTLRVGSLGGRRSLVKMPAGATDIGVLNEAQLIDELRRAQALFAVQWTQIPPSGLLVCTANAVGTPVLAPCRGAIPELVSSSSQLLSGSDPEALVQKLESWTQLGFPVAHAKPSARLLRVAAQWQRILQPDPSPWDC